MYYPTIEAFYAEYRKEMERTAQRLDKSYAASVRASLDAMRRTITGLSAEQRERIEYHLRESGLRYDHIRQYMLQLCEQRTPEPA